MGGLEPVPPQNCDVQQHVGTAAIGHNEPVTLCHIEPFDGAGQFYEIKPRLRAAISAEPGIGILHSHFAAAQWISPQFEKSRTADRRRHRINLIQDSTATRR